MAKLNIRTYPDDILRMKAHEVTKIAEQESKLIDDMIETMRKNDGVGLAAPQVGVLKRIIIAAPQGGKKELHVFVNPVITKTRGESIGTEGCLSVPGTCGDVKRAQKIWVRAQDRSGKKISFTADNFLARIIQHETDHLFGKLYIDHLGFNDRQTVIDCLKKVDRL
jgi:peptide deformylase